MDEQLGRRRLGARGPEVSEVGVGTNNFGRRLDQAGARRVVDAALDLGVNLFDTADIYGNGESERFLGQALQGRRDRAVLATKFGMRKPGLEPSDRRGSHEYVRRALEGSLRRLQVETIDLYQMHEPDPNTPITETLLALQEAVTAGQVRWVGVSNFSALQLREAVAAAEAIGLEVLVSTQEEYSLQKRSLESEVLPTLDELGLGLLPYYPLASGLRTGKYRRGEPPPPGTRLAGSGQGSPLDDPATFDVVEQLERFAADRHVSLLGVAIGSLLGRPQVSSVIAGAMSPEQVEANCAAASWRPSTADWAELDLITLGGQGAL